MPDAVAISAPVFDADGRAVAALTISGIASRYARERLVADALAVRAVAEAISVDLGYPPPADSGLDDPASAARRALEAMCDDRLGAGGRAGVARARPEPGSGHVRRPAAHPGQALGAALLPDGEHHRGDREREQHRRQHVDLDRDPALRGAEDVEREGDRGPGVEVRDHEVVDREREGEQRGRDDRRRRAAAG